MPMAMWTMCKIQKRKLSGIFDNLFKDACSRTGATCFQLQKYTMICSAFWKPPLKVDELYNPLMVSKNISDVIDVMSKSPFSKLG